VAAAREDATGPIYAMPLNTTPTPEAMPIERALQKTTRLIPVLMLAPPILAANPPSTTQHRQAY